MFKKKKEVVVPLPTLPKRWEAKDAKSMAEVKRLRNTIVALERIYETIDEYVNKGRTQFNLYRKYEDGQYDFNRFESGIIDLNYLESDLVSLGYEIKQVAADPAQYVLTWEDAK